jgi:ATP-binding protein involved in chromosome partitioning
MPDPRSEADDTHTLVLSALERVIDPEIRRPITELDMIGGVEVAHGTATIDLKLTIVGCPAADTIERDVRAAAASVTGISDVDLRVRVMSKAERDALTDRLRGGRSREPQFGPDSLTKIYAITSGKGGVGKSTVTANIGVALAQSGLRVGIIDADVFGFSIPGLLGIGDAKPTKVSDMILPPVAFGVKVISVGMFVRDTGSGRAVSWRGPMLHRTITQFLSDVYFGDIDVLLLDLPPGTGDIAITIGQLLPHSEVIVVTTPQAAAAEVAERSAIVARQTGQRVIGVIENMAGFVQSDGTVVDLFGSGGGADAAARLSTTEQPVPVLASVPISVAVREGGDLGVPVVLSHPDDPAARAINALATAIATRGRGLAGKKLGLTVS